MCGVAAERQSVKTWFYELSAMAELPWFQLETGRLVLDPAVGAVIDFHAHLAFTFIAKDRIDQTRVTEPVETFLPEKGRAFDLERYMNKSLTSADLRRLKRELVLGSFLPGGARSTHTAANLLRRMDDMQIRSSVLHAIDMPHISRNSETYLAVAKNEPRLIAFGSAHPYSFNAPGRLRKLADQGIRGLKLHPVNQTTYPNDPRAMALYEVCRERRLPVFWHCGPAGIEPERTRKYARVHYYEEPLSRFPDVTFFLGHSGCLEYAQAVELARRYPNAILDLSCQGLDGTRLILEKVDHDRIVFGSDWPFYHQGPGIAKVLIATEGDRSLQRKILFDNAARLLSLS